MSRPMQSYLSFALLTAACAIRGVFEAVELERQEFGPKSYRVEMQIGDSAYSLLDDRLTPCPDS